MASKLSQQELRKLMREKAQSKKTTRVESPLAKYDEQNNLWCIVCNHMIGSDLHWSTHLIGKAHKKKVEEIKQTKHLNSKILSNTNLKRSLTSEEANHPAKVSKFSHVSEFSKKEIQIKEERKAVVGNRSQESRDTTVQAPSNVDTSLPQDFFDNGVQPSATVIATSVSQVMDVDSPAGSSETVTSLPKGFFDDPLLDAKVRKTPFKDPLEEQMEIFRKAIAEETLVSEGIIEEEIEQLQKEKILTEIDEQISKWSKVEEYHKLLESKKLKKLNVDNSSSTEVKQMEQSSDTDQEDSDDDIDLNNVNFWRSKDVFL